jgi:CHAT domain-containing protein
VADASRARALAERQGVTAPTARARAASLRQLSRATGSTLLFYWLGPQQSWVWTVTGEKVSVIELPPASQIESLVTENQAAIQNALADPLSVPGSAGERLFRMLLEPVSAAVARARNVVIVPDGALHRLNFETLLVPEEGSVARHYWIEDQTVQIAPSLAMLERAAEAAAGRGPASLLLVGNAPARPPEFPALGYALSEMAAIQKQFAATAVSVFEGERASPAAFKSAAPEKFSVIHFTSHAVANTESPLDSAVILSGPDDGYKLYARDVAGLPLKAELVTVSACRSAGERAYAGEGLVGFAWAFLRGGSRRVIAGLWDVDDRSTAALMETLYARIAAGASPPAALREAKLALIKSGYARPYYWAPFQMFTVVI